MSRKRTLAAQVLAGVAQDTTQSASDRSTAAALLAQMADEESLAISAEAIRWYNVSLRELTIFFLKCAVAATPAMLLLIILYVQAAILTQVLPSLIGLQ